MLNTKTSNNPLKDILADLQLFQQTNYCYNYIKNKYPDGEDAKILYSSEVASACFRQANEFIISAQNANLSTNPLLYSYALNNFAKGMAYLLYLDEEMLKYFKDHGFCISDNNIKDNILEKENRHLNKIIDKFYETVEKFIDWICNKFGIGESKELVNKFQEETNTYLDPEKQLEHEEREKEWDLEI